MTSSGPTRSATPTSWWHLEQTTVTVVLIGRYTAQRPWVRFEIDESIKRRNGLLGVYIHHLWAPRDPVPTILTAIRPAELPPKPYVPDGIPFPAYPWDQDVGKFSAAIESAGRWADSWRSFPPPSRSLLPPPFTRFRS